MDYLQHSSRRCKIAAQLCFQVGAATNFLQGKGIYYGGK